MYKILVSGYYGFNNVGDEAILRGLVEGIRREEEDCDLVVLSRYPQFTAQKHHVRSINRMNLLQICKEMKTAHLFVSGGGSLLQDVTSHRSMVYYLGLIFLAKSIFKKKVMIYSQGIGPVKGRINRFLMKRILNTVDLINVRDGVSAEALKEMGITKEALITTDTVFDMDTPDEDKGRQLLQDLGVTGKNLTIGLSIRMWQDLDLKIVKESVVLIRKLVETYHGDVVLIPFQYYKDSRIMNHVRQQLEDLQDHVFMVQDYLYVEDYLSVTGCMDLMISMRLHGLIFSLIMGTRPLGISYDPKIQSFLGEIGLPAAMEVDQMNGEALFFQAQEAICHLEEWKEDARKLQKQLLLKSQEHNKALWTLLKSERKIGWND